MWGKNLPIPTLQFIRKGIFLTQLNFILTDLNILELTFDCRYGGNQPFSDAGADLSLLRLQRLKYLSVSDDVDVRERIAVKMINTTRLKIFMISCLFRFRKNVKQD